MVSFLGRVLLRTAPRPGSGRTCPVCGEGAAGEERMIAVRGMRFHQHCAGYRMRQLSANRRV
ncbi:MAG: hypothetical protein QOG63_1074 [Thermoleophilaceae bacterium]|jgi:hypothetical protein|nr:hypothetical protein [Thermoleophilaceae bacterium]